MTEVASRRPIRAVKKARQGCGHDVHNRRPGQGRPLCRPHRADEQVAEKATGVIILHRSPDPISIPIAIRYA